MRAPGVRMTARTRAGPFRTEGGIPRCCRSVALVPSASGRLHFGGSVLGMRDRETCPRLATMTGRDGG